MQVKTITVTIDSSENSTLDLDGFAGQSCEKASDDFRGEDVVKVERKKPAYYTGQLVQQKKSQH